MKKKAKQGAAIIGGSDGPTSYFVLLKNKKPTLKQRFLQWKHNKKKARIAKNISANPHTLDEVCEYLQAKHQFTEVSKDSEAYQEEYRELRAGFLMQYAPEVLGEQSDMPELKGHSEEELKRFMEAMEVRKQTAQRVPKEVFDIEFRLFKKQMDDGEMHVPIEKRYEYIGGGAGGSKKIIRRFDKIYKDIHRYYGVTNEDIERKSERYETLIRRLAD